MVTELDIDLVAGVAEVVVDMVEVGMAETALRHAMGEAVAQGTGGE